MSKKKKKKTHTNGNRLLQVLSDQFVTPCLFLLTEHAQSAFDGS